MFSWWKGVLAAAILVGAATPGVGDAADPALVKRGAYLAQIMDCSGCHTPGVMTGQPDFSKPLAGGTIGFRVGDLGIFFPPNLTPHPETGLGGWSAEDIENAVRRGVRPDGRELAPIMPWRSYAALQPDDMAALVAFLQSLPPIEHQVPAPHGIGQPVPWPYLDVVMPK